jgi:hypothetical protein
VSFQGTVRNMRSRSLFLVGAWIGSLVGPFDTLLGCAFAGAVSWDGCQNRLGLAGHLLKTGI